MGSRSVHLAGQDITRWVSALPAIQPSAGEYGQVIAAPLPSLTGIDIHGFWSVGNPASPFFGAPSVQGYPLEVRKGDSVVWAGKVQGVKANGSTADVTLSSTLQRTLEGHLIYESPATTGETPAAIARKILTLYGVAWDPASFGASEALYAANLISVRVQQSTPRVKIIDALQALAQVGVARLSVVDDVVRFEAYQVPTAAPVATFTDREGSPCTLWGFPEVQPLEKDRCTGYVVTGLGSASASLGSDDGFRMTIDGGDAAIVKILTLQTAIWVGDRWYAYLNTPQDRISVVVPALIGKQLALGFPVAVDWTAWETPVTFDITGLDNGSALSTRVTGTTRG